MNGSFTEKDVARDKPNINGLTDRLTRLAYGLK